ncbi:MAG: TolC family protein [Planctomycetota bacterium]
MIERVRFWSLAGVSAGFILGCTPVDRWRVFEEQWPQRAEQREDWIAEAPEALKADAAYDPFAEVGSGAPIELSIEQAAVLALRRNRDLSVRQFGPAIAGAFELIERGVYDPEVFGEFTFRQEEAIETDRGTGESFSVVGDNASTGAGLRQRLPTGTELEGVVEQTRNSSTRSPELQQARLGLTLTQSLLQGFGPAVNLAAVRQAELGVLASRYELRRFVEVLLAEVETSYWLYTLAEERIAIFERSLEVARRQADETRQRIEVGLLAETQGVAVDAEVALREQQLIDARSELRAARLRLRRLLNSSETLEDSNQRIDAISDPRMEAEPIGEVGERLRLAMVMRADLNEATVRLDQNRLETVVTRNGLLPRLDVFVTLGKSGFADTFPRSFDNVDGEAYDVAAGLSLRGAIGDRADRGADALARANRDQAAAAVSNLRQLITLDVQLAVNEVERARRQIDASAATRLLREATLEAERERFEVGASTGLLVALAQSELLVAEIAEVESVINHRLAWTNLYLAEGSLLERRGVSVGRRR